MMQHQESLEFTPEEEYQNWKRNSPLLYQRLVVHKLHYPSLTFNWLPQKIESKNSVAYKYVFASNSSGAEQEEFVYFAQIEFPALSEDITEQSKAPENNVYWTVSHPGEANRIVRHPTNPQLIATKTVEGVVNIYQNQKEFPVQLLSGHTDQGYGIDWKPYGLASGGYDGRIMAWKDVEATNITPTFNQKYTDKIEDVKWINENAILAVADDGCSTVWDIRSPHVQSQYKWHQTELNTVDINQYQNNLVLVGTGGGVVKVCDMRNPTVNLHSYDMHSQSVIRVEWSPHTPNIFASASTDTSIVIWDILKVGSDIPLNQTQERPSQILFDHKGHQGPISDMNWNPYQQLLGSVDQKFNTLQFYQIRPFITQNQPVEYEYNRNQLFSR